MRLVKPAITLLAVVVCTSAQQAVAQDVDELLGRIQAVGPKGKGSVAAARAWRQVVQEGPEVLPQVLTALNKANPIAANFLRSAVDAIAENTLNQKRELPTKELEAFVLDTSNVGIGRRLAYEWLVRVDKSAPKRLLAGMLNDPGQELRRDAVQVLLDRAQKSFDAEKNEVARRQYQKALEHARDQDQVKLIAKRLEKLDVKVDLTDHFGFITRWRIVGPFDSSGGVGFNRNYPPEKKIDVQAKYIGKDKKSVSWQVHETDLALGKVDLNAILGDLHGAVAYAHATVISKTERPVEIRASSNNAVRIYLNGKQVYFREEYHHGMRMDQHVGRGTLKAGPNDILIKICQNEQTESWAQTWSFQLRVTDALGAKVPLAVAKID